MKELLAFHQAVNDPRGAALAASGDPIGYLCSYAPEELIHAAGFHPHRLFPGQAEISLADNHLQPYCCHLLRGILEDGLSGRLDYIYGMVFPHTCDAVQRVSDIWRLNIPQAFFTDVGMPTKLKAKSARRYMTLVLSRFKAELEDAADMEITPERLGESIRLYNGIRRHLTALYALKSDHPHILSGEDLSTVVRATMIMDRETALEHLASLAARLKEAAAERPPTTAKRILITGSVCDTPDIYSLIEAAGGSVVGDDLCTGQRWFQGLVPEDLPPLEGLVSRYLDRYICPAKHLDPIARRDRLIQLIQTHRADGVVFLRLKFCDPHAFDYPHLVQTLEEVGLPHLLVETGRMDESREQLATRLETFTEMI